MVKQIIVGISGGIAAYKSAYLVRLLKAAGHNVQVVMTQSAMQFIGPLTLQALSGRPVRTTLWDSAAEAAMSHIELARWADHIIIVPASANIIARLAQGLADDLLTTLCLATAAPVTIVPAMNQKMWQHAATQHNLTVLKARGVAIIPPESGEQACGEVGVGRMAEPEHIFTVLQATVPVLQGQHVLITAGPTREAIDPVRFISNRSSGKMGYAIAAAARAAGAKVTLVSGPVALEADVGVELVKVTSARDMLDAVMARMESVDVFMATAAVADFCCTQPATQKKSKQTMELQLNLQPNSDILATVTRKFPDVLSVGFCAQTHDVLQYAQQKLKQKQCNLMIANDVSKDDSGFDSDYNEVTVLWADGQQFLARATKTRIAEQLIEIVGNKLLMNAAK